MTDDTYQARLISEDSEETIDLESIDGLPQKAVIRSESVDGHQVDVVWELDPAEEQPTYRKSDGEGYGEGGVV